MFDLCLVFDYSAALDHSPSKYISEVREALTSGDGYRLEADCFSDHGFQEDMMSKEIACDCRCGICCMFAVVEASREDVKREPRIALHQEPREFRSGVGPVWSLNTVTPSGGRGPCRFYDSSNTDGRVCSIYETRPNACRAYDCDTGFANQLRDSGVPMDDLPSNV